MMDNRWPVDVEKLKRHGTRISQMAFPTEESHPGFDKLKKLAARVGRTFYDHREHAVARQRLGVYMRTLPDGQIPYYAKLVMLVPVPVSGIATGRGAYWAVASSVVDEIALEIHEERRAEWQAKYGDAMFVVVQEGE